MFLLLPLWQKNLLNSHIDFGASLPCEASLLALCFHQVKSQTECSFWIIGMLRIGEDTSEERKENVAFVTFWQAFLGTTSSIITGFIQHLVHSVLKWFHHSPPRLRFYLRFVNTLDFSYWVVFLYDDHKKSKNNVALLLPLLVSAAIIPSTLPKFHHRINSALQLDMSFKWRALFWVSVSFFLIMEADGLIKETIPIIPTALLFLMLSTSLTGNYNYSGGSFILCYKSSICAHWKWLLVCGLREKLLGYYHLNKKKRLQNLIYSLTLSHMKTSWYFYFSFWGMLTGM